MQTDDALDLRIQSTDGEIIKVLTQANNKNYNLRNWIYTNFPNANEFKLSTYGVNQIYENTSSGSVFMKLPNNKILSITYTNYEGPGASMGIKHIQEFEQILTSIFILE